ncbi:hypothetical protein [Actinophytocola sp.]
MLHAAADEADAGRVSPADAPDLLASAVLALLAGDRHPLEDV